MSLITKPSELKNNSCIKGLILGVTGSGKTTLAMSASKPLLIDFEQGILRVDQRFRLESVQANAYETFLEVLNSNEIKSYETIIIDPLGEMADQIKAYILKNNPKLGKSNITLYPAIGQEFKNLWSILKNRNLNILFVSHVEEGKSGDVDTIKIKCDGNFIKNFLPTQMDFVCVLKKRGIDDKTMRILDFSQTEEFKFGKKFSGLEDEMLVPNVTGKNDYIKRIIFAKYAEKNNREEELNQKYDSLINIIQSAIEEIETLEQASNYYKELVEGKKEVIFDSIFRDKYFFSEKMKKLGFIFNKESKEFETKICD